MLSVPLVVRVFFPLDEELALLPGSLTPSLVESVTRLGTWMPFPIAARMVLYFTKVDVSEATERRATERAGQAYVEVQTAQVEMLEKELPDSPEGPSVQLLSVDGAFVPLVHKQWAEVKTLAIGVVGEPVLEKGEWAVHTNELTYFSRVAHHETFARLATVETHRRGTEKAGVVCAVVDGADWEQEFIDLHCPNAVRIIDWGHSTGYVAKVAQAVFGPGTAATSEWLGEQLHELKHGDPQKVLDQIRGLRDQLSAQVKEGVGCEALKTVTASLEYLEKRKAQIRYAEFVALGYPIGSGAVESANKLLVEFRLKGAGMHWTRDHVDPMVALRTVACNDRWEEAWPQICERLRQQKAERAEHERSANGKAKVDAAKDATSPEVQIARTSKGPETAAAEGAAAEPAIIEFKPANGPWRPTADHPWRRMRIGRARPGGIPATTNAET